MFSESQHSRQISGSSIFLEKIGIAVGCFLVFSCMAKAQEAKTVDVYLLAGQSNMQGQGVVDLDHPEYYNGGKGILKNVMKAPQSKAVYAHIVGENGQFVIRDDVFVRFVTKDKIKRGPLTIGFTGYDGKHHIGPEFQFGHVMGKATDHPVLLIKTAWGGKSLYKDFRPPSSGGQVGDYFRKMISECQAGLANFSVEIPELKGCRPRLKGFVWLQGWNDMFSKESLDEYQSNLVHLINDVRQELKAPTLPVIIGELGNGGPDASPNMLRLRQAQRDAVQKNHLSHVLFVETSGFARPASASPNVGHGHHWFGNAESYFMIGDALARGMLKLNRKK